MKYIKINELHNSLQQIGITGGDTVMVHSSLFSLGFLEGYKLNEQAEAYLDCLLNTLEDSGTLIAPVFNFDFCNGLPFTVKETPSKKMGVLSEAIRKHPNAVRSSHPMQSVSAIGPLAKKITDKDTPSAYSEGGSFDVMIRLHAKLLFLGTSLQPASLIHWVEKQMKVPYRYWKEFTGSWTSSDGETDEKTYSMLAKSEILKPKLTLNDLENRLLNEEKMRVSPLGLSSLSSVTFDDFINTAVDMVEKDPFVLLSNRDEVLRIYHSQPESDKV